MAHCSEAVPRRNCGRGAGGRVRLPAIAPRQGVQDCSVGESISSLIASAEGGDPSAADALFAALYAELHRLARRQLARDGAAT